MKNLIILRSIFLITLFLFSVQLKANKYADTKNSIFDELHYQEVIEVNLVLNKAKIFNNRKNQEKHNAIFSFHNQKGELQTWNIKVEQRGKFRRMKCENLPPLKLNFKNQSKYLFKILHVQIYELPRTFRKILPKCYPPCQ